MPCLLRSLVGRGPADLNRRPLSILLEVKQCWLTSLSLGCLFLLLLPPLSLLPIKPKFNPFPIKYYKIINQLLKDVTTSLTKTSIFIKR
ncbi:hypothetical protein ES705_26658 [subsurface metagenome]